MTHVEHGRARHEGRRLVLCAKSTWNPAIRREHALAVAAATRGVRVDFIERPMDIRQWSRWRAPQHRPLNAVDVRITSRRTIAPGHLNRAAEMMDAWSLASTLRRLTPAHEQPDAVVVNTPWSWSATGRLSGVRRVFDVADDWRDLLPGRRTAISRMYARIAAEADSIIVASPALAPLFTGRAVHIPNGVSSELLAAPSRSTRVPRSMVYVGTLSERFDAELMTAVLDLLPDWSLQLVGPCAYAGHGERPDATLTGLLRRHPDRASWKPAIPREQLPATLDSGDVLILPNKPSLTMGQDSMKLYDYAARGRPIVSTAIRLPKESPNGLFVATSAADFARQVRSASATDSAANRGWAARNSWEERIPRWLDAVLGQSDRDNGPKAS